MYIDNKLSKLVEESADANSLLNAIAATLQLEPGQILTPNVEMQDELGEIMRGVSEEYGYDVSEDTIAIERSLDTEAELPKAERVITGKWVLYIADEGFRLSDYEVEETSVVTGAIVADLGYNPRKPQSRKIPTVKFPSIAWEMV
jgi:hypothetical protein